MNDIADPERSGPKIHEVKSGRPMKFYATHETYAILYKFKNRSWQVNNGVRLAYAGLSGYVNLAGTLRPTGPDSRYDEKQDRRLQLFADSVAYHNCLAQLTNPAFYDNPNPRMVKLELERLEKKLYGDSKFHRKPGRRKYRAAVSIYGALSSLAVIGAVCALTYLYIHNLPLPDLEEYYVLVPVVLPLPFLLISSSLRTICRKALGTLRQKLVKKPICQPCP